MATHENLNQFLEVKIGSDKNFCLIFALVFTIVGFYPLLKAHSPHLWAIGLALVFLVLAYTFPKIISPLNYIWSRFGILLGKIITPLIMGVIYFSIFLLMGVMLKILKKDLLRLKPQKSAKTYWIERENTTFTPESLKNQF